MPPQQHQCAYADENHLKIFLPKVPEFRWWIATHTACTSQLAAALLQLLPISCLFILHLPLSQLAATSIDTIICNIESHSVQLTNLPSGHSHANAAVSQLILSGRNHSLLCPARCSCTYTSLLFSSMCLYFLFFLSCRRSEEKGWDGRSCSLAGLLFKVCYLFTTYVKQVSPGPFGIWPMVHRGLNEMDWGSGWVGEGLATLPAHEFLPALIVASGPGLWLTLSALSSGGLAISPVTLLLTGLSHPMVSIRAFQDSFSFFVKIHLTVFAKIHFLSCASPRNHVNKGMQPDLLDWSEEMCHPKKNDR